MDTSTRVYNLVIHVYLKPCIAIGYYLYLQPVEDVVILHARVSLLCRIYIVPAYPSHVLWQVYKTLQINCIWNFMFHLCLNNECVFLLQKKVK